MPDIRDRFVRNIGPVVEPPGKQIAGTHDRRSSPLSICIKIIPQLRLHLSNAGRGLPKRDIRAPSAAISFRHVAFLHTRGGGTCKTFAIEDHYQHPHESIALRIARERARIRKIDLYRVSSVLRD